MRTAIINIDVYNTLIRLIHCDGDYTKLADTYSITKSLRHCTAITMSREQCNGIVIAFIDKTISPSTIAHEASHAANTIFESIGYVTDVINDEAQAYLIGCITKKCHLFLQQYNAVALECM